MSTTIPMVRRAAISVKDGEISEAFSKLAKHVGVSEHAMQHAYHIAIAKVFDVEDRGWKFELSLYSPAEPRLLILDEEQT